MTQQAPNPIDVQDFQFKLHCRLNVFSNTDNNVFKTPCNLLANSSRFGLLFVGTASSNFQVIRVSNIEKNLEKEAESNEYNRRVISIFSPPKHLSVNCDSTMLAVVIEKNMCPFVLIYDISSFLKEVVTVIQEIRLSSSSNIFITETTWNPTIANIYTACKSDGTVGLYELKDAGVEIKELPADSQASCICWSPKGKQLAVGSSAGKITQYKPDLKAMKSVNPPPLDGFVGVVALQWISSFQFIALYKSINSETCALFVVDAPKVGDVIFTNYEDICYSYGNIRPVQFYTIHQSIWNILVVASSNSMEVGVLGSEKEQWTQWILADVARAELPLNSNKQETLPIGLALDTSGVEPILWGEHSLPPAPFLFILSHYGVLCCFRMINIKSGVSSICQAPELLSDNSGLSLFEKWSNTDNKPDSAKVEPLKEKLATPPLYVQQIPPDITVVPISAKNEPSKSVTPPSKPSLFASPPFSSVGPPAWQKFSNIATSVSSDSPSETTNTVIQKNETKVVQEETDLLISNLIREECGILQKELQVLLSKGNSLKIQLGTDSEAVQLVQDADSMQNFLKEVIENSTVQASEVHSLKQILIQTWAWYEDARSRYTQSQDAALDTLSRIQQLDPVSQRYLSNIQYLTYYLESQLIQANRALDEQWENFQDSCKKISKLKIPTIETIYQTMVRQSAVLQKQKYILKDISNRIRAQRSKVNGQSLIVSLGHVDQLERDLLKLQLDPQNILYAQYERVFDTQKKLTAPKIKKLGKLLLERHITHISVNKPQLSNTSLQTLLNSSTQMKQKDETILGAALSPIPSQKLAPFYNADVVQSTPKKTVEKKKIEEPTKPIVTKVPVQLEAHPIENLTKNEVTGVEISAPSSTSLFNFSFSKTTPTLHTKVEPSTTSVFQFTPATSATSQFSFAPSFSLFSPTQSSVSANVTSSTVPENKPLSTTATSAFVPTTQLAFSFTAKPDNSLSITTNTVKPLPTFSFSAPVTTVVGKTESTPTKVTSPQVTVTSPQVTVTSASAAPFKFSSPKTSTLITTTSFPVFNFKSPVSISSTPTSAAVTVTPVSLQINTTKKSSTLLESSPVQAVITTVSSDSVFGFTNPSTTQSYLLNFNSSVSQTNVEQQPSFSFTSSIFSPTATTTSGSAVTTSLKSIFNPIMTTSTATSIVKDSAFLDTKVTTTSSVGNVPSTTTTSPITTSPTTTTSASIIFQSLSPSVTTTTASANIFATSAPITPIFSTITTTLSNNAATTTSSSPSTFSLPIVTESIFGTSITSSTSVFPSTAFGSVNNSVFTQPATTVFPKSTTSSVFAQPSTTVTSSVFAQPSTTVTSSFTTTQPSIFGETATTTSSIFGSQKSSFENASGFDKPMFGSAPAFGTSTAATTSIFGAATPAQVFGSNTSIFGNSATAPSGFSQPSSTFSFSSASANIPNVDTKFGFGKSAFSFGNTQQNAEGGAFSFNTLNMGVPTTTASSPMTSAFGQSSNANPFAKSTSQEQKPFGGGSLFGASPSATSSSIFGGGGGGPSNSVFGNPSSQTFGSSPGFGSSATFGQSSFGQSNFGSSFGGAQPSGLFSSNTQSVAQTGFGAFGQTPQKSTGFGGAPVFGGSPSGFGAPPTFGSGGSPFGATPNSSFGKVFGEPSNTGGAFAASNQPQSSTFANLASQNTLGFGSLAQQSQPIQNQSPFSNSSSFSAWR